MRKLQIPFIVIALFFISCNKYLDVTPKGVLIPETTEDFEKMLNSYDATESFTNELLYMTDDYYYAFTQLDQTATANCYYWKPVITVDVNASPEIWAPLYKRIYITNVLINNILNSTGGTEQKKLSVYAEALTLKSVYYMDLLTVFSKEYDSTKASQTLGLPWVNSIIVSDTVPGRSTLQANLDSMISNTKKAIPYLAKSNINYYRVNKAAAYGSLSRMYLYMGKFYQAGLYADSALLLNSTVLDYNDYEEYYDAPTYDNNPENILQRAGTDGSPYNMAYSKELQKMFDLKHDKRISLLSYYRKRDSSYIRSSFDGEYSYGITVPEMLLTKAEVLARNGNLEDAMTILNDFRSKRIESDYFTPLTASTSKEALTYILQERRRELAFCGLRWFDMKRLNHLGEMPTIQRIDAGSTNVRATLSPNSSNYTFHIPTRVMQFNPGMIQND